jgi:FkbM family methyltransferase
VKTSTPELRLDELLDEEVLHAKTRAEVSFDLAAGGLKDNLVLFGAGGFGRSINRKLRELQIQPLAFADNNQALWGKRIDGTEVISPMQAASLYGQHAVFVVSIWNGEAADRMGDRVRQLKSLGCRVVLPFGHLFWKYHEAFLPHYCLDLPEKLLTQKHLVRAAMQLWSDNSSREEFVAQVGFRTSLDFDLISRSVEGKHYFPPGLFSITDDEVFVDCGAFDGDTMADFVQQTGGRFREFLAFEPDPITYPRLQARVESLDGGIRERIKIRQEATGRKPGTIDFQATGTMLSTTGSGSSVVPVTDLDSALATVEPTYIKFDVEGFELEALMGAAQVLSRTRPILAVSLTTCRIIFGRFLFFWPPCCRNDITSSSVRMALSPGTWFAMRFRKKGSAPISCRRISRALA